MGSLVETAFKYGPAIYEGLAGKKAGDSSARQLRVIAGQERAAAQYEARDIHRKARYLASRGKAVAAASGASASDPTVVNLLADIGAEGEYQAMMALFNGERRAKGAEAQASAAQREGQASLFSGILDTGAKLFAEKYG